MCFSAKKKQGPQINARFYSLQSAIFCAVHQFQSSNTDTHPFHRVDGIRQFTILDRNPLFPLVHHVVDFFKLLLTTLLRVQQGDLVKLLNVCGNKDGQLFVKIL